MNWSYIVHQTHQKAPAFLIQFLLLSELNGFKVHNQYIQQQK